MCPALRWKRPPFQKVAAERQDAATISWLKRKTMHGYLKNGALFSAADPKGGGGGI